MPDIWIFYATDTLREVTDYISKSVRQWALDHRIH